MAPVRLALVRLAPVRLALVRLALVRLALRRSAPVRLASTKMARVRLALRRSAPVRLASTRMARVRLALRRSALRRLALVRLAHLPPASSLNHLLCASRISGISSSVMVIVVFLLFPVRLQKSVEITRRNQLYCVSVYSSTIVFREHVPPWVGYPSKGITVPVKYRENPKPAYVTHLSLHCKISCPTEL